MYYVYILRSKINSGKTYTGYSSDLRKRLVAHNQGDCKHTSQYRPWEIEWYCAFNNRLKAMRFEKYLKSSSGKAFSNKRFLS
ncbi:MAG: GIY-YIG nuclease family protein [Candidatus Marinimicrobia bacterium]|nr:GIY-YIG nuclease family protein [Candidatus Neomarinimicrobiota bacterium]